MARVVVGAGVVGRWHAYAAQWLGASVVAIVYPRPTAAGHLAGQLRDAAVFSDLDAALAAREAELVRRFHAAALGAGGPPVADFETLAAARLIECVRTGG